MSQQDKGKQVAENSKASTQSQIWQMAQAMQSLQQALSDQRCDYDSLRELLGAENTRLSTENSMLKSSVHSCRPSASGSWRPTNLEGVQTRLNMDAVGGTLGHALFSPRISVQQPEP